MQKIKLLFETLRKKYSSIKALKPYPEIHWLSIDNSGLESFRASHAAGRINIKAQGYLGAIYALQQIHTGIRSGHLADFLGHIKPRFKIRPLWIEDSIKALLGQPHKIEEFVTTVLELGYNTIVVDQYNDEINLTSLCAALQSYGLKVVLKLSHFQAQQQAICSPLTPAYSDKVKSYINQISSQNAHYDFLFWESQWQHPEFLEAPGMDFYTLPELVLEEARLVENILEKSKTLIFYVPADQEESAQQSASWMSRLANDLRQNTVLAYSVTAEDCLLNNQSPHPFWNQLRHQIEKSFSPLMPVLNVGQVPQSEGLWPLLVHDLIDEYMLRCQNEHFLGVLCVANQLPAKKGIHHCNLWTASQMMWKAQIPAFMWVETWFSAHRPDWNYNFYAPFFYQIGLLSKQLNQLRSLAKQQSAGHPSSHECRLFVDSLLVQIDTLISRIDKEERKCLQKSENIALGEYFKFFAEDARFIILQILPDLNLSLPHLLNEKDRQSSLEQRSKRRLMHEQKQGKEFLF
ncbi:MULTISPECIES: hypothetical protein [unclassified Neochlamydia]|uniref:hypothetical protein n=1 Tax=unclassified Neochlamydia TaxID=2643326 RepID=UPI00140E0721|nr:MULTISPECIES: hypothetical protein [unclassified Neochlamydia]MBS4167181.1 Uncharacterized protein [Neochlamydia sp. AcF65]MBS4171414.1 Uncharacterized protein [Neochlamydia sp. AcF95]NGY95220.1 hypothetical protein [Neochlamydia sp. AcF84]